MVKKTDNPGVEEVRNYDIKLLIRVLIQFLRHCLRN